jgi:hypothetical protein
MQVTAWSNGSPRSSGAGYGLRISPTDRDRYFEAGWDHVDVDLGVYGHAAIPLSESFWARCTELRSAAVGRWLLGHHLAPWPTGAPPTLALLHVGGNAFRLSKTT